jgi:predicted ATPase/DNA-binding SARP family transcriptional activator
MEPQRYLRCLGQPALFTAAGEPIRFRTRKHLALLVYIAVEERVHRRDRLAELLWPRVTAIEARHSLATALSILRPRVGLDALETSRDQVRLVPGRVVLDLARLRSGDVLGTEVTGPLEVAAFLDGFDINDSAEFTHWKDGQQARLLPVIKDALLVLMDRCRRTGDTRQIEQLADRMLALDELSEEAIRAKMEARAFAGDRLTALETFEAWKRKLADELQAAPSDLVEGMAVRLRRRGWERTTLANIPNVPTDQWRNRPFIGRTAEYQLLYEIWEGMRRGMAGHALVLGDSGVGKTTLVKRLTTAAGLQGAAISRVQCYDVERDVPYSMLSGLVIGLLDRSGVSATSPEALAELSRTVPQVRQRFPDVSKAPESHGETVRIRLAEAFLEMLTAIAEEHPVVLVVDDLHFADDVSVAVLHLIMRRAQTQPFMILLVARIGEIAHSSQALRLQESAAALGMKELEISPLNKKESREMLDSLFVNDETQPGQTVQRALLRAAGGFPMVLELLVEDWRTSGQQSLALAIDAMTDELGVAESATVAYRQILQRITRSLDRTTHHVLNLAAVLGPRLNDLDMYGIVDLSPGQTIAGMAELVNRRVLRDGTQGLEFVNELLRAAAYVGIPQSLRHVLHSSTADRLISRAAHGAGGLGLETAWHCIRASRRDEAIRFLLCGARESLTVGAVHSAERALSSALPLLGAAERQEARLLLSEALQEQGRWNESLAILDGAGPEEASATALLLRIIAAHHTAYPSTEDLLLNVCRVRNIIETNKDTHVQVKAAGALASFMNHLRNPDHAKKLLDCVNQIPAQALNDDDLTCLAESKARLYYNTYQLDECLEEIQAIESRLKTMRYVNTTMGSLHTGLGAIACSQGRYGDARAKFRDAYDIAVRLGNESAKRARAVQLGLCCFRLGEYEEAVHWSSIGTESSGVEFHGYIDCQAAMYLSWSYSVQNNQKKAYEAISWLDYRLPPIVPSWLRQSWLLAKADTLLLLGSSQDALAVGSAAIGHPRPVLQSSFFAGMFSRWLALTSVRTSRDTAALEHIRSMRDNLGRFDALDRVEILCADRLLRIHAPEIIQDVSEPIRNGLRHLPAAVADQLIRLGLLAR